MGVLARCDQQDRCDIRADADRGAQSWVGPDGELVEVGAQVIEVTGEGLVLASECPQRGLGRQVGIGEVTAGAHAGTALDSFRGLERVQLAAELVAGGQHEVADLVGDADASDSCGAERQAQHPDRLDDPGAVFGCP